MKWMKRCWLSMTRRPVKSILLLLAVFVMANLLAGSLVIIQTSDTVKSEIKRGLGAEASITADFGSLSAYDFDQLLDQFEEVADQLCQDERVDYGEYHYTLKASLMFGDNGFSNTIDPRPLILYGTNIADSADFREGSHKLLVNRRNFTEEELNSDEPLIIVNGSLSHMNIMGTLVNTGFTDEGRELTLTLMKNTGFGEEPLEYKFKAKVVGAYSNKGSSDNYVYMSNQALRKIFEEMNEKDGSLLNLDFAAFKLKDANDLESFDSDVRTMITNLPKEFVYDSTSSAYERSAGPVENLEVIAKVILVVSVCATIIILGLVIVFFISDRKKEIGIYASLGEKKKNVVMQIMSEVLIISLCAVTLAGFSGVALGNQLSRYMLEVQRYVKREQDLGAIAKLPVVYKPVENALTTYSRDEVIDTYQTKADAQYFVTLYATATLTIILSCALPMAYLTHIKPKDNLL